MIQFKLFGFLKDVEINNLMNNPEKERKKQSVMCHHSILLGAFSTYFLIINYSLEMDCVSFFVSWFDILDSLQARTV